MSDNPVKDFSDVLSEFLRRHTAEINRAVYTIHQKDAEISRLADVLEWYAAPENYTDGKPGEMRGLMNCQPTVKYWKCDHGSRARRALGRE
jgi:hypothetical protein